MISFIFVLYQFQALGWSISALAIFQLPFWAAYEIWRQNKQTLYDKIISSLKPNSEWGPSNPRIKQQYDDVMNIYKEK